ncbi:MAG: hypothetical protein ACRDBG_24950 [Waterburya sp.]
MSQLAIGDVLGNYRITSFGYTDKNKKNTHLELCHPAAQFVPDNVRFITRFTANIEKGQTPRVGKKHLGRRYSIAQNILARVYNSKAPYFKFYGGRGIQCHLGFDASSVALNLYLVEGYQDTLTIERIDTNGHYVLGNLRWASMREQSQNKRDNTSIPGISFCELTQRYRVNVRDDDGRSIKLDGASYTFSLFRYGTKSNALKHATQYRDNIRKRLGF